MTDPIAPRQRAPEEEEEFYAQGYWAPEFLTDYVDKWAAAGPERVFVYDGDIRVSWGLLRGRSLALARSLSALGLARGERVAVQLPNWNEFVITYLALARLGLVMVPIMPVYREREVGHVLTQSGARAYIYTPTFRMVDYRAMADALLPGRPQVQWRIAVRATDRVDGELSYDDLVAGTAVDAGEPSGLGPTPSSEDHHVLVFTSGTEANAKGCLHTWNSYAFTPRTQVKIYAFGRDDIELVVSPITHTTGLAGGLLKPLIGGGAVCLMDVWEPGRAVDLIDEVGCTQVTGATPFLALLLQAIRSRPGSGKALRIFICGGAPVPAALVRDAADVMGCRVLACYGQSEVLLLTSTTVDDDEQVVSNTDGRPLDGVEIRTIGPDSEARPSGVEGEICYRSPGAMLTYWDNREAFEKILLPDGWRRTGDLGRLNEAGYLRVTGRVKEVIIRGGANISVREVEDLLLEHPSVAAIAVVGVPDDVLGERVGAVVVAAPGAIPRLSELVAYLRDDCKVAKQKLPERLLILDELPVSATGKVLKFELVKRLVVEGTYMMEGEK